ncbi:MAG: hypothetical protein [Wendovervirus sonii]|uniref:Uncharacterized protein n=1 Tax=phage Lak_Megaphage_Sonny TaxID=3109229 RepID=A0ABZ0Z7C8_9CAUD|nr:MAG: hypothetical protein [phage Lak_Megaphage_Sonny]
MDKKLQETIMTQISHKLKKALNEAEDENETIVVTKKMWDDLIGQINALEDDLSDLQRYVGYDSCANPY